MKFAEQARIVSEEAKAATIAWSHSKALEILASRIEEIKKLINRASSSGLHCIDVNFVYSDTYYYSKYGPSTDWQQIDREVIDGISSFLTEEGFKFTVNMERLTLIMEDRYGPVFHISW